MGTAGDSLTYRNGIQFSTKDRDNDQISGSCASSTYHHRAWRDKDCTEPYLNGLYRSGLDGWKGVDWYHFLNNDNSLTFAQIKLCLSLIQQTMGINTLCAIIGLKKTHTITNSTHTLTLGRLWYIIDWLIFTMCVMINDVIL